MIATVELSLELRRFRRSRFPANKVAAILDRPAEALRQVLINEYRPAPESVGIATRRSSTRVAGVSLLAPCVLRFRRKAAETWDRVSLAVEPCPAYLVSGAARTVWEHSIPALDELRYSITLRTLVAKAPSGEEARNGSALLILRSFHLHRETATGSVTELCSLLEPFPVRLNRRGFANGLGSDSCFWPAKGAGAHGQILIR
jgi:hypothetical protein